MRACVHYDVAVHDAHAHLWRVTLYISKPVARQRVSLPVWIPGSYLIREFAKHLQGLQAQQLNQPVKARQIDKCTWQLSCKASQLVSVTYEVYALDASVRAAWLTDQRAFFNPSSLCLRVEGAEHLPHSLTIFRPACRALRSVATSARAIDTPISSATAALGSYSFEDFDELVDTPFVMGAAWRGRFTARGISHELVVSGASPSFDGQRLLADTRKIVQACLSFWHPDGGKAPFDRYVFMLDAVEEGYGGLEHRCSTALICSRRDLPRLNVSEASEGYTTLLGLISHEYFHTWNVKRLKPIEFTRYDYTQENYSAMLWFFEGFTSYYDDLLLLRAGLIDRSQYLSLLAKTINQVHQTPGRMVQSAAQASMDAWVKYYRPDENTPNATVSYYTKGALIALCLDLRLRQGGPRLAASSLDDVMRCLWERSGAANPGGGGITEADFAQALRELSGRSFSAEIKAWVHGTAELPVGDLLAQHGVTVEAQKASAGSMAQRLGLRISEINGRVVIKSVLRGSLAQEAGLAAGDEWLAVDDWRLAKLDDISWLVAPSRDATALVCRDQRVLRVPLRLASTPALMAQTVQLKIADAAAARAWLEA